MPLTTNYDGVDGISRALDVGDNRALRYLPITVECTTANLTNADCYTIEIEVGQLAIGMLSEIDSTVNSKCKDVHHLGIIGMVDCIGIGAASNHRINNLTRESATKQTHIGRIDVTMQDARDIVAEIDANKLATQRITIAMLKENLLSDIIAATIEIHSHILAIEGER